MTRHSRGERLDAAGTLTRAPLEALAMLVRGFGAAGHALATR
jgi:hypothetical protein